MKLGRESENPVPAAFIDIMTVLFSSSSPTQSAGYQKRDAKETYALEIKRAKKNRNETIH